MVFLTIKALKGQCHEIFCFWFFSWTSVPPAPEYCIRTVSNFFEKFAEIFSSQGAPPVSTTPVANFYTSFASVVDTGGKFATCLNDTGGKQWEQLSNCWQLKTNLKKKCIYMLTLQKKYWKFFWLKIFSICPLELRILREVSNKFEMALMV